MIKTYDNTRTPTSGDGEHHVKTAPVDAEQLKTLIGDAVKEAEAEDPKLLRKRIAELEKQLRERPTAPVEVVKTVEVPVLANGQLERTEKAAEQFTGAVERFSAVLVDLKTTVARAAQKPAPAGRLSGPSRPTLPPAPKSPGNHPVSGGRVSTPRPATSPAPSDGPLPEGERRILTAAAQHAGGVSREQLSVLTGYKRSSRDTYLQRLRSRGLVEVRGDSIEATADGVAALGSGFEPLPTGDALREHWLNRLPEGERKVLEVLIQHHPDAIPRDALDEPTGYKRSSRDTYLQRLTSRKLVVAVGRGEVRASDELFG